MKGTMIVIVIGKLGTITKGFVKGVENVEIICQVETIQITALTKIVQNTERGSGNLRRLAVTQTQV